MSTDDTRETKPNESAKEGSETGTKALLRKTRGRTALWSETIVESRSKV